jgi:hypothetical protein
LVTADGQPNIGTFFYPWYGKYRHWVDGGHNPPTTWAAYYLPNLLGTSSTPVTNNCPGGGATTGTPTFADALYDSNDTATITKQMQLMTNIGIEFGISSWWGQGTYEDTAFDKIIHEVHPQLATTHSDYQRFKWCCYYEDEGFETPSVAQLISDLNYIKDNYTTSPHYLKVNNVPVIFVYNAAHTGFDPIDDLERWEDARASVPFYVVMKRDPLSAGADPSRMNSWHEYAPADAYYAALSLGGGGHSAFISPGFHLFDDVVRLAPATTAQFNTACQNLKNADVRWKLIQTWNEWGESTGIEPALEINHNDAGTFTLKTTQRPVNQQLHLIFKSWFRP